MTRAPRIAIGGGGVGGLAAALALERRGAEIVVCEQSPALNEIGAGLKPHALGSGAGALHRIRPWSRLCLLQTRSPDWLKMKNPARSAVKREAEEDWGR
jgi:2-polyprenyl-6-methoxyphenol hydroxylase-like FAD-dependent oxidoreductase